jgi:hypothetical protein
MGSLQSRPSGTGVESQRLIEGNDKFAEKMVWGIGRNLAIDDGSLTSNGEVVKDIDEITGQIIHDQVTIVLIVPLKPSPTVSSACGASTPGENKVKGKTEINRIFMDVNQTVLDRYQEDMDREKFKSFARRDIMETIEKSPHLAYSEFISIDADVAFVLVRPKHGAVSERNLAGKFEYALPFNEKAYRKQRCPVDPDKNTKTMPYLDNKPFPAHHTYNDDLKDDLEPPSEIDGIRFIMQELYSMFNLSAVQELGVVTKIFPAANWAEMDRVWMAMGLLPRQTESHEMRSYFGEEVAFFFNFHAFYIRMLLYLLPLALVVAVAQAPSMNLSFDVQNYCKVGLGVVLVVWAVLLKQYFQYEINQERHRWGMDQNANIEMNALRASLEKEQPRSVSVRHMSNMAWFWPTFGNVVMVIYMLVFVVVILQEALQIADTKIRSYSFTATTFIFSYIWGSKLAPLLTKLEVKEGKAKLRLYNNVLSRKLAIVKLFLFLFPLFNIAILAPVTRRVCSNNGDSHSEMVDSLAQKYFNMSGPRAFTLLGDDVDHTHDQFRAYLNHNMITSHGMYGKMLSGLSAIKFSRPLGHGVCVKGCPPVQCDLTDGPGRLKISCLTSCYFELQTSLRSLFFSHLLCSILFSVIGVVLVHFRAKNEMDNKGKKKDDSPKIQGGWEPRGQRRQFYSFLQFQEKQYDEANYEYLSWGGSYTEDFLEVILNFAVLICFGVINPFLAILSLIFQILENRVLVLRMIFITCRPYPTISDGIGAWGDLLDFIVQIALFLNGALVVLMMRGPWEYWSGIYKFALFSCWVMAGTVVGVMARTLLPAYSPDFIKKNDENQLMKGGVAAQRHKRHMELELEKGMTR